MQRQKGGRRRGGKKKHKRNKQEPVTPDGIPAIPRGTGERVGTLPLGFTEFRGEEGDRRLGGSTTQTGPNLLEENSENESQLAEVCGVVRYLMTYAVNAEMKRDGRTAFDIARESRHSNKAGYLQQPQILKGIGTETKPTPPLLHQNPQNREGSLLNSPKNFDSKIASGSDSNVRSAASRDGGNVDSNTSDGSGMRNPPRENNASCPPPRKKKNGCGSSIPDKDRLNGEHGVGSRGGVARGDQKQGDGFGLGTPGISSQPNRLSKDVDEEIRRMFSTATLKPRIPQQSEVTIPRDLETEK
eukprot:CAMPEP_0184505464 /NCGR_PEP_ID=MMETSP0113_2-20130426/53001_1 /TAXON_ID=91329 /ORGANISM="Norrisiella sphaerica, Strain BC52" /LENGTH=299 /DNA_ID=CAMNT_0026895153 /DNA_START=686 /DNA_END=1585 /DNA_ORIENTATION=-